MSGALTVGYQPGGHGVVTREAVFRCLDAGGGRWTNGQVRAALGWGGETSGPVSEELRSLCRSGLVQRHGTRTTATYSTGRCFACHNSRRLRAESFGVREWRVLRGRGFAAGDRCHYCDGSGKGGE